MSGRLRLYTYIAAIVMCAIALYAFQRDPSNWHSNTPIFIACSLIGLICAVEFASWLDRRRGIGHWYVTLVAGLALISVAFLQLSNWPKVDWVQFGIFLLIGLLYFPLMNAEARQDHLGNPE